MCLCRRRRSQAAQRAAQARAAAEHAAVTESVPEPVEPAVVVSESEVADVEKSETV